VTVIDSVERPAECAVAVLPEAEIILPLSGLIDEEAERVKLRKTLADLERQIGGHRSKLGNEGFVSRAPAAVVEQARSKLAELESQRESVLQLLERG
jgi:valyl-tRNA synthetase